MEYLLPVQDFLEVFWAESQVRWILLTVMVNVLVALFAGLYAGEFSFQKLGEFLYRKILPLGGTYCVFWIFGRAVPDLEPLTLAAFAAVELKLLADLAESGIKLGLPLGDRIGGAVKKE